MPIVNVVSRGAKNKTGKADLSPLELFGPLFPVSVGKPTDVYYKQKEQDLSAQKNRSPNIRMLEETFYALMDTGANKSAISIDLANKVGLKPVDKRPLKGVTGTEEVPIYLGFVMLHQNPSIYIYGRLYGLHADNVGPHDIILGRDFMRDGLFVYNASTGHCSFAK